MSNGWLQDGGIEIYKEYGAYERHFNQMQSGCRRLASTWLLAAFGGIGYAVRKEFNSDVIASGTAVSLIALASGTGIFLLWLLDVVVYHRLLVAVTKAAGKLERNSGWPQLRDDFAAVVKSPLSITTYLKAYLPSLQAAKTKGP